MKVHRSKNWLDFIAEDSYEAAWLEEFFQESVVLVQSGKQTRGDKPPKYHFIVYTKG